MRSSASKGFQDIANPLFFASDAAARAQSDGLHLLRCAFHIVIDHRKIVAAVTEHLLPGAFEPALDFVVGILAASADAALEFGAGRRQNEYRHSSRQLLLDL